MVNGHDAMTTALVGGGARPTSEVVLLVEDSDVDAALTAAILQRCTFGPIGVERVSRVADAVEPDRRQPCCILLDLGLPDAHDLDGLHQVVERYPDVPIVCLTANSDMTNAAAALGHGAQDYLVKGHYDPETLDRTVRYAIERKRTEMDREAAHRLNQAILDSIDANTAVVDSAGTIVAVNEPWRRFALENSGSAAATGVGANYVAVCVAGARSDLISADVARALQAMLAGKLDRFETEYPCHAPTEERWFLLRAASLGTQGAVLLHIPITEQKRLQLELERLAHHDPLTGLPNRSLLFDRLDFLLHQRRLAPVAVAFVDLDGFKPVNDRYGHSAGDEVLCETARRLQAATRPGDLVARIGGDEFVVVAHVANEEGARVLARRLSDALTGGWTVAGGQVPLSGTVGLVHIGATETVDVSAAIAAADHAMYEAKQEARGSIRVSDFDGRLIA